MAQQIQIKQINGIVNVAQELTLNATQTLSSVAAAQQYFITDASPAANLIITINPACLDGTLIWFRVDNTFTKIATIYDSGNPMNSGLRAANGDRVIVWADETVLLCKFNGVWRRVGGNYRPINGAMRRTSQQSLTASAWNQVVFQDMINDEGFEHCFDSVNGYFVAFRSSRYFFSMNLNVTGLNNDEGGIASFGNPPSPVAGLPNAQAYSVQKTGLSRMQLAVTIQRDMALNDVVAGYVNVGAGTPVLPYTSTSVEQVLFFHELIA